MSALHFRDSGYTAHSNKLLHMHTNCTFELLFITTVFSCQPVSGLIRVVYHLHPSLKGTLMVAVKQRRSHTLYFPFKFLNWSRNNQLPSGQAFLKSSHLLLKQEENSLYDITSTYSITRTKWKTWQ